jgi:hypothetical protein
MPEDSILLDPGTGGERLRTRSSTIGGNEVHEQGVYRPGEDTYYAYADAIAPAASKHMITIANASGSGVFVQLRKLFVINISGGTAAVIRFDMRKGTTIAGGTTVTPVKADSLNPNLPAGVTVVTGATTFNGSTLLFPWLSLNTANTTTQPLTTAMFQQATNILIEADTVQELTLQPAEAASLQQNSGSAATTGTFGFLLAFTMTSL